MSRQVRIWLGRARAALVGITRTRAGRSCPVRCQSCPGSDSCLSSLTVALGPADHADFPGPVRWAMASRLATVGSAASARGTPEPRSACVGRPGRSAQARLRQVNRQDARADGLAGDRRVDHLGEHRSEVRRRGRLRDSALVVGEHNHERTRAVLTDSFTSVYLYIYTSLYPPVFTRVWADRCGDRHTASFGH
jgi:hypothetical protein